MKTIKLYKIDSKGKTRVWSIWTDGDTIFTEHGLLGGKTQISEKKSVGKNLGKANETSPTEQAELEAKSIARKKQDKGYDPVLAKEGSIRLSPMLAQKWDHKKKKLSYPVDVQPKLDGVRCLIYWQDDEVVLRSRGGKPYDVPHIAKELEQKNLPKNIVLDGELYIHDMPFQLFMRLVKKNRPESIDLKFHVYDIVNLDGLDEPWSVRKYMIDDIFEEDLYNCDYVFPVETGTVLSEDEIFDMQSYYINEGYEGLIIRLDGGKYKLGHRSKDLLKFKNFDDEEFKIIGFDEGIGKAVGSIIWVCETASGNTFNVVPRGSYEQRKDWFNKGQSFVGSQLTVRYFGKSEDGIPRFPVGINIRGDGE